MAEQKSLAVKFNEWRVFPRVFSILFGTLLYDTSVWFMALSDPNTQQASFAASMVTAAAGFFKFYVDSGKAPKDE
ncbi:MAG: hypothetical protein ACRCVV_22000 [Shewanella sp.]